MTFEDHNQLDQLGFDDLLAETEAINEDNAFIKETAHLPNGLEAAITFHFEQIAQHDRAMCNLNFDIAHQIRKDAHLLAKKLNGGNPGILASDDAPGNILATECAIQNGTIPLWGQDGNFNVETNGIVANIKMQGIFGIGSLAMPYLGFCVHAIEFEKPFITKTGYRSFLGAYVQPKQGMTTCDFVCAVINDYIQHELHGKLENIGNY